MLACLTHALTMPTINAPHSHAPNALISHSGQEFKTDLVWAPDALEALRCAAEGYLVGLMEEVSLESLHARRTVVYPKDLQLVRRVRGERS